MSVHYRDKYWYVHWRDEYGKRHTKSFGIGEHGKFLAMSYDATIKAEKKKFRILSKLGVHDVTSEQKVGDMHGLKEKYQNLYKNPYISIADIFDIIMTDLGLPPRYRDVVASVRVNNNRTKLSAKLRMDVFDRDRHACQICGAKAPDVVLHVDHILPVSKGGLTELRNLRTLCAECNLGRGDKPFVLGAA